MTKTAPRHSKQTQSKPQININIMNTKEVVKFIASCDYAHIVTAEGTKTVVNCHYLRLYVKRFAKKIETHTSKPVWRIATPATLNDWINAKEKSFYWHADELFLSADFPLDLGPTLQD